MKWTLIFLLSLFGLVMAFLTVFVIPMKLEPLFWLVIFILCAYLIAKNAPGKFFLHGFLVSIVNCIWITAAHLYFFHSYMANHEKMAKMMIDMPMSNHPHRMMAATGLLTGIVSGLVLGLFAFIAGKLLKKNNPV
jgi:hypothetical protein